MYSGASRSILAIVDSCWLYWFLDRDASSVDALQAIRIPLFASKSMICKSIYFKISLEFSLLPHFLIRMIYTRPLADKKFL
jgi:hypothetical protein